MRKIILTIAAVLTLIGCSPEDNTLSVENLLTREISWMSNSEDFGKGFYYNQDGELMITNIFKPSPELDCYINIFSCNQVGTEIIGDSLVVYMSNNCDPNNDGDVDYTLTLTVEGSVLKMSRDNGEVYYYYADSTTIICILI